MRSLALLLALACYAPADPAPLDVAGRRACIVDDSTYYHYQLPGQAGDVVGRFGDTYCLTFGAESVTPSEAPYVMLFHYVDSAAGIDTVMADRFTLPVLAGAYVHVGAELRFSFALEGGNENPWFWIWATHTAPAGGLSQTSMRRGTPAAGDSLRYVWRWDP